MKHWMKPGIVVLLALGLSAGSRIAGSTGAANDRPATGQSEAFDLLITGGRVYDGTGNPWFYADVGVRDGVIAALGRLDGATAARTIDAKGKVVAPGFIDIHSHADDERRAENSLRSNDRRRRAAPNLVSQGITTVVVNPDGRSAWPIAEQRASFERLGMGPNAILLVGHNTVRRLAMGEDFRRHARPDEVEAMRDLVRRAMREGAWGLSAGLEYIPGRWSTTDEVVALVEEIASYGGVYISHQRSEGAEPMWYWPSRDEGRPPSLLDAVKETIEIGERTGATVVASHIKAKGANYWGSSGAAIRLIQRARERGVNVWADQYPYNTTGSDGSTVLIPRWAINTDDGSNEPKRNYADALRRALDDPIRADEVHRDVVHEIARRGGAENIVLFEYPDPSFIGKSLAELAAAREISAVEMAIAIQLEGFPDRPGGARIRGFSLWEMDIEAYAPQPWTATASDAGIALPDDGPVHARFYGTFPRKIRRYAIERGVMTIEDAIRSATSLPARILGLRDRGLVSEGQRADLVVLDLERLNDRATFVEPHQYAEGVEYVLVGGEFVVDDGQLTWKLPGVVITPGLIARRRGTG